MGNVIKNLGYALLISVCLFACSDGEKQDENEVGKTLLVGLWQSQSVQGAYTGEYRECFDFRKDGTFTVYDYDSDSGWYNDGEGVWEYIGGSLSLTYTDQLNTFKVESVTENTLILIKPESDGNITVTYQRIDQLVLFPTPEVTFVGVWSGIVGYTCISGQHKLEKGRLTLKADATGILVYAGEGAFTFSYVVNQNEKKIYINFNDGRHTEFQYTTWTNKQLTLVEMCPSCNKNVSMELKRVDEVRKIVITSTERYVDTYSFTYDEQGRINRMEYTSTDSEYDDNEEADISIVYSGSQIQVTNAVVDNSPYKVTYTLNEDGTVKKSVSESRFSGHLYTATLIFIYTADGYLSAIHGADGMYTGSVTATWNANQLVRMIDHENRKTDFASQSVFVPNASIDIPYFMIFRYDDDIVDSEDNTAVLYASMLNLLGKGTGYLLSSAKKYHDNEDWDNDFQFSYEWDNYGHLVGIHDRSSYNGKDATSEIYDAQISISYY